MKKELSSIEVFFLAKELKQLEGLRLDKIYQLAKQEFLFQFQRQNYLVIKLPGAAYLAEEKPKTPEHMGGAAGKLRKELGNQKLHKVFQARSERILCFEFEKTKLLIELFAKGRIITGAYSLPKSTDTFNLPEKEFVNEFTASGENISKTLAVKFGLGGLYARELCIRTAAELTAKPDKDSAKKIFVELKELLTQKIHAHLVYDNGNIADAVPFMLEAYKHLRNKTEKSFSRALEKAFARKKTTAREKQIEKISKMIRIQEKNLAELEKKAEREQKKGEFFYENYQEIKAFIDAVRSMREEKKSRDEIKKKFKKIKDINNATGDIIVDI